ncbi:AraC family ligand binding domain-containing protein [Thermobacillus composti]|uniref:AraC family ligand binding domain-containing protein n=1 Tax=Thermobacillus composti TaxID=377615 RepID=UPI00022C41DC|nr:AraC family ligand binding domain-containing protein [Thermobacillus composti]
MTLRDQFGLPIDASFNQDQYPTGRFHAHPEYEIYYFHGGGCTYLIGGRMFELAPGDLIIMHGMTLHAPIINRRLPYLRTIVHFDPAFAAELLRPPLPFRPNASPDTDRSAGRATSSRSRSRALLRAAAGRDRR